MSIVKTFDAEALQRLGGASIAEALETTVDYLVTGDKTGLLALAHHEGTRIVSARDFAALFA